MKTFILSLVASTCLASCGVAIPYAALDALDDDSCDCVDAILPATDDTEPGVEPTAVPSECPKHGKKGKGHGKGD
jgi:hypothetical protein